MPLKGFNRESLTFGSNWCHWRIMVWSTSVRTSCQFRLGMLVSVNTEIVRSSAIEFGKTEYALIAKGYATQKQLINSTIQVNMRLTLMMFVRELGWIDFHQSRTVSFCPTSQLNGNSPFWYAIIWGPSAAIASPASIPANNGLSPISYSASSSFTRHCPRQSWAATLTLLSFIELEPVILIAPGLVGAYPRVRKTIEERYSVH